MKPHGLLFKAEMVRAILAGRKTQTRRLAKSTKPAHVVGQPLWVRETFLYVGPGSGSDLPSYVEERANPANHKPENCWYRADAEVPGHKWTPAIHMPRGCSRIHMVCTEVRYQRLQEIDEFDAIAEGAPDYEEGIDPPPPDSDPEWCWSYRASYIRLWDQINGAGSWYSNPFVWAYTFKVLP